MSTNNLELAQCVRQPSQGAGFFSFFNLGGLTCEFYNALGWHVFILKDAFKPIKSYTHEERSWRYMLELDGTRRLNFAYMRFRAFAKNRVREIENA